MEKEALKEKLKQHPFTKGLSEAHLQKLVTLVSEETFMPGEILFHEGDEARSLYLIESGKIALSTYIPGRGSLMIETAGPGEVVGWSSAVPPRRKYFDAKAIDDAQALVLDGEKLLVLCEEDHHLGYEIFKRLLQVVAHRLQATRIQLLDIYGLGRER